MELTNRNLTNLKQYNLYVTGTNYTDIRSVGIPYQTLDGTWRLRFNTCGTVSVAVNSLTLTIQGIITRTIPTYNVYQAVAMETAGSTAGGLARCNAGSSSIVGNTTANVTNWHFSGDIELQSKPTFVQE